jgi:D-alanyl-D-alanine carboxypeptidase
MKKKTIVKLALSTIVIAAPAIGVSGVIANDGAASKDEVKLAKKAYGFAKKAEKALAKGDGVQAVILAENAVAIELNNLDYRGLLARAYMKEGRFQSAERTLMDVIELGQSDARTIVSLALTRIAQGKVDSAIALVEANQAKLPASDFGLALALAGEPKRGIAVLTEAIRSDNSTARTRQNLALAYALDGQWRNSQTMAVQDMPKDLADQRLVEWAQYARPGAFQTRIAGLLGVSPKEDMGQPVRLALNVVAGEVNVAAASQAPAAMAEAPVQPMAELAAVGPAPVETAVEQNTPFFAEPAVKVAVADQVSVPVNKSNITYVSKPVYSVTFAANKSAPLIKAPTGPAKSSGPVRVAEKASAKPVKLAMADTSEAAPRTVSGTHIVQLGAYYSAESAQKAWTQLKGKHDVLDGLSSASSVAVVNGKRYVRLAASGFGDFASANAACGKIKANGGDCVVKNVGGNGAVRLAAAKPKAKSMKVVSIASKTRFVRQIASR